MDPTLARNIAQYSHVERRDRHGEPIVEHVARVVAAVPPEAQTLAWLHDVLEHSATTAAELRDQGLTAVELAALHTLTRRAGESYELYVLRVAYAPGAAGRLARTVKLADLDDHIARDWVPGAPPYDWARRHIAVGADDDERRVALVEHGADLLGVVAIGAVSQVPHPGPQPGARRAADGHGRQ